MCRRLFPRVLFCLAVLALDASGSGAGSPALRDPLSQPKFVNQLPNPLDPGFLFQPTVPGGTGYEIGIYQFSQNLGLVDPETGAPLETTVWGYGTSHETATYPGRTLLAAKDVPITVRWTNNLVDEANQPLPHLLPVDTSVHMRSIRDGPTIPWGCPRANTKYRL